MRDVDSSLLVEVVVGAVFTSVTVVTVLHQSAGPERLSLEPSADVDLVRLLSDSCCVRVQQNVIILSVNLSLLDRAAWLCALFVCCCSFGFHLCLSSLLPCKAPLPGGRRKAEFEAHLL